MAYATAADVKDKDISRKVAQAGWVDADVESRIAEGDASIDAFLSALGYTLPFAATPPLVKQLSILYGRYAVMRDIHHGFSPSQGGATGFSEFKKRFDEILGMLKDGTLELVDASGATIATGVSTQFGIQISSEGLQRALTMGDQTGESLDEAAYADPERLGEDD